MRTLRLVGVSHRTAPVEWREGLAVPEANLPELTRALQERAGAAEAVVLSTCNRVEVYAVTPADDASEERLRGALAGARGDAALRAAFYALSGEAAVRHLFRVAAGLDSLVVGESEILGQVKRAYDLSHRARATGKLMNVLFQRALHVGKRVRADTKIAEGPTSVARLAVSLAGRVFSDLSTRRVLVLGAGPMAELAVRAFKSQNVTDLWVANRTREKADLLAGAWGARVVPFERRAEALRDADIVLCSTGAPAAVFRREDVAAVLPHRRGRALFFIDIAVPRDVDPAVHALDNVYLYNIDDLESLVAESLVKRREEIARANGLVEGKTEEFYAWYVAWARGDIAALRHGSGSFSRAALSDGGR